jgi:hypothetical protein
MLIEPQIPDVPLTIGDQVNFAGLFLGTVS